MAAAIPYIAMAISAAGAVQGAQAQAQSNYYNAAVAQRNGAIAVEQASRDADQQGRAARMKLGSMRAAYGASGVTPEGSPLDVLEASASAAELDRQNILYRGNLKALGYSDTSTLDKYGGEVALKQGDYKAAGTLMQGAGSAIGGMGGGGGG